MSDIRINLRKITEFLSSWKFPAVVVSLLFVGAAIALIVFATQ